MPVAYIPKPIKLKNIAKINKLGIDISELSRSQAKGLDTFINLIKKANKRSDYRDYVDDYIYEMADYLKGLKAPQVRDTIRSVKIQISRGGKDYKQEPKTHKFTLELDICEYLKNN